MKNLLIFFTLLFFCTACANENYQNAGIGGVVGAGLGALAGGMLAKKEDRSKGIIMGAIAGGAIGAVAGYTISSYHVEQIKSSEITKKEFEKETGQKVTKNTKALFYSIDNPSRVKKGEEAELTSRVKIISAHKMDLIEEIHIINSSGVSIEHGKFHFDKISQNGEYLSIARINTRNIEQKGRYVIEKTLFVDGRIYKKETKEMNIV